MKSNLDKKFKNDVQLEENGIWLDVSPEVSFLVRRVGGKNAKRVGEVTARIYKPFSKQVASGTLSEEKDDELYLRAFIESCLADWKGVEIDGKLVDFDFETAYRLLKELPELSNTLQRHAADSKNYREDLGNS